MNQKCGWILRTFHSRETSLLKHLWKTLVQSHIDYCSQLYAPGKASDVKRLENLQKWFTKRIPEISNLNYWERIRALKQYSQQRRMERYRILYTWKILENLAPNCGLTVISTIRRGRELKVPMLKGKQSIRTLRDQSFQVKGPQLFNSLPMNIRNITKVSVDEFKMHLDKYLEKIPDEPSVDGLVPSACNQFTAVPSNSILDQSRIAARTPGL